MKKSLSALIVLCLAAMWVGCKKSEPAAPAAPKGAAQAGDPVSDGLTLVTIKVPHMT